MFSVTAKLLSNSLEHIKDLFKVLSPWPPERPMDTNRMKKYFHFIL